MKIAGTDRCISCMQPLSKSGACSHCGYNEADYTVSSRALKPGTCLAGRYYIGRVIGQGGFGITYVAWDELLEIRVAIKSFLPENNDGGRGNKDLREARIMSKFIALPGIVVAKDFFEDNNAAYLIMEYVNGVRISNYIKKNGPMSVNEMLDKMEPVISSLAAIHESGYLHKDISANNIMIDEDGKLVLIDFGAARTIEHSDVTITVAVKIGYSPEEQYRTTGRLGPWSDIYSLCATMYYMLTGIVPAESVERVINDRVIPLEDNVSIDADVNIKKAIDRGMAVMAADRYQSVEELYPELYSGRKLSKIKSAGIPDNIMFGGDSGNNTVTGTATATGTGTISETSIRHALQKRHEAKDKKRKTARRRHITGRLITGVLIMVGALIVVSGVLLIYNRMSDVDGYVSNDIPQISAGVSSHDDNRTISVDSQNTDIQNDNTQSDGISGIAPTASPDNNNSTDVVSEAGSDIFKVVPSCVGITYKKAAKKLKASGFVVEKKTKYSSKKKNIVISQSIPADTRVADGTAIILTVSKGKKSASTKPTAVPTTGAGTNTRQGTPGTSSSSKKKARVDDSAGALN